MRQKKKILVSAIRFQHSNKISYNYTKDLGTVLDYIKQACPALRRTSLLRELQHYFAQDAQEFKRFYSNLVIEAKNAPKNLDSPGVHQKNKQQVGFFSAQPTENKKEVDESKSKIDNNPSSLK